MSNVRHAAANQQAQWWKAGFVVFGASVLAISLLGVWFSLGQAATAQSPGVRPVAAIARPFAFIPFASPRPIANVEFEDGQGRKRTLADFRGKLVLLNLWATWCPSCRAEMPTLDRLQSLLGGADLEVVALSIDRGGQAVVKSFYDEINVQRLAIYVDATAAAGSKLGIIGLPTTLLLDRTGSEIGRVTGPAEWDSPEVIDTMRRYLLQQKM